MRLRTQFLLSAFAADQFPNAAKTGGAPEVAFLGRSNVGKSSLINALLGETQARVSSTPGRTRSINFFGLYEEAASGKVKAIPALVFADLPGYGYAKISKSISAEWPAFIDPYLAERPALKLCCCLVDTNIPPQESDRQLLDFLREVGRDFVVIGTKSDRLSSNALAKSVAALKRFHEIETMIPCSAKLGKQDRGLKQLWERLLALQGAAAERH
ncbi:MAG: ribosome biogenesis GTP-binding protein YsxC [Terriglobus roseus]|nr:ribosome biogenesis GTP-binding protein YsxC [Terriglobus roseus]